MVIKVYGNIGITAPECISRQSDKAVAIFRHTTQGKDMQI